MKIVHANTADAYGGAAIAARRLHLGLLEVGQDSSLAVMKKTDASEKTLLVGGKVSRRILPPIINRLEDTLRNRLYSRPEHPAYCTFSILPTFFSRALNGVPKDILHLHWLGSRFMTPWDIGRLTGPVVWTIHDVWPFTGGCHFTLTDCVRYKEQCGCCPELCSDRESDVSRIHWRLKRKALARIKPVFVSPSSAFLSQAAQSSLLQDCRIEHIPNGIDTEAFRPIPKEQARAILGIPDDVPVALFGAVGGDRDPHKGFDLLLDALHGLAGKTPLRLMLLGASQIETPLPMPAHCLGHLHDTVSLALAYSAADIFVCPSRRDNLPNTIMEAMACGTPVAAFAVGGIPDMVEDGLNGCLAKPQDSQELTRAIEHLLQDPERRQRMGLAAREKVEREFSLPLIVQRYTRLYEDILENSRG